MNSTHLGKVCHIDMGQAPRGSSYNSSGFGFPLLAGAGDFGANTPVATKYTSDPTKLSEPNDLLLCIRATIGDLNWSDRIYCLGRGVAGLRPKNGALDKNYLWQWLSFARADLEKKARGSTFKQVSRRDIAELEIPLPSTLDEQRRIAAILDKADTIRRKHQQALALADDFLKAMFMEMFGDPVLNEKGFQVAALESLCGVISDCLHTTPNHFPEPNAFPSIRSSELQSGFIDLATAKYVSHEEYLIRTQRHTPIAGDVIYCREGARYGSVGLVEEGMTPCLGQRTMLLQARRGVATSEFLWCLLRSTAIVRQADEKVGGAASPHVNIKDIRKFICIKPPLELQKKFSRIVKKVLAFRAQEIVYQRQSANLFASLSQRAFRGEL